jgi:methylglutaconyl-CoA hydratase
MDAPTRYEVAGGVATITLDAPQRRNAFSQDLIAGVLDGIERAVDDGGVRVLVLTNTGTTFSAGADLKEDRAALGPGAKSFVDVVAAIAACPKPVVGRVAGHAAGGGAAVVVACDLAVAVDTARIGITEVRLGIAPVPVAQLLAARLGTRALSEAFLVGEMMPASRAAELGMVNLAVPADELDATVDRFVGGLVRGGPVALAITKRTLAELCGLPGAEDAGPRAAAADRAGGGGAVTGGGAAAGDDAARREAREGTAAFLEKRPASWVPAG